jgi:2-amino-4-hydroxy-6-hydroxymethyldihydropteridine diphosphokinase/dihydropteroate synthase
VACIYARSSWKTPNVRHGPCRSYGNRTDSKAMSRRFATMSDKTHAFIALGSNMGNRLENIEQACRNIDHIPHTRIIRTSGLWDTEPMYVENQDRFLNGVCEIETALKPLELLDELLSIEDRLGRVRVVDKGPRTVDLDILLFGDEVINHDRLIVPHKLMLERDFVLQPLCEYVSVQLLSVILPY